VSPSFARLRWALVAPCAVAAWGAVLIGGLLLHDHLDRSLCAPVEWESGFCADPRVAHLLDLLVVAFAGLSAAAVLVTAVAVAPSYKRSVACVTFALGAAVAIALGVLGHAWAEMTCALAVGLATAVLVVSRLQPPKTSMDATSR
jgi:hypothetical protein